MKACPQEWVAGFLFTDDYRKVATIRKARPEWQKGKLNGVGGKVEPGETPYQAMCREWTEESGLVSPPNWREYCCLDWKGGRVYFFEAYSAWECNGFRYKDVDEVVNWFAINDDLYRETIPNLRWLIPLAMDKDNVVAEVKERDAWNALPGTGVEPVCVYQHDKDDYELPANYAKMIAEGRSKLFEPDPCPHGCVGGTVLVGLTIHADKDGNRTCEHVSQYPCPLHALGVMA
jgi:8-oxo-dGTP diphosphatase